MRAHWRLLLCLHESASERVLLEYPCLHATKGEHIAMIYLWVNPRSSHIRLLAVDKGCERISYRLPKMVHLMEGEAINK